MKHGTLKIHSKEWVRVNTDITQTERVWGGLGRARGGGERC